MSVVQVGLVDITGDVNAELVQAAAAALNVRVAHDLPRFNWSRRSFMKRQQERRKKLD